MKNNPDIRFRGFDEEWDQSTLREISDKVMEKNSDFSIREVFTNSAEHGIMSQKDFFNHAIANNKNINGYYVVQPNDFVYNPRMSVTAPVGPINRNALGRTGIMSPLYYVFRTHDIGVEYLEYFFKTRIWHQFMWNNGDNGARGDRFSIKNEVFQEMPIPYPSSPEEQHKIAQFFSRLDSLINAEDKKLERLKTIKSASLEKMFPKQGEAIPEIRFKGFSDSWEEHKLKEITQRITRKNTDLESKLTLTISAHHGLIAQEDFFNRRIASSQLQGYYLIKKGEFAYNKSYSSDYPVGAVKCLSEYEMGVLSTLYIVFSLANHIEPYWFTTYFETSIWHSDILKRAAEGARNHGLLNISSDDFFDIPILIPTKKDEQKCISKYFSRLDSLISAQEQKIEKLRSLKKSFLEKMFVSTPK